jgi:hypothetical protein
MHFTIALLAVTIKMLQIDCVVQPLEHVYDLTRVLKTLLAVPNLFKFSLGEGVQAEGRRLHTAREHLNRD